MSTLPKRTLRIWLRDIALGAGFFLLFLYWTFPLAAVTQRVELEAASALSTPQSPAEVKIGDLRTSWLTGVVLERVMLSRVDPAGGPPRAVLFPEIHARLALWSYLRGRTALVLGAKIFGGTVEAEVTESKQINTLVVNASNLKLAETKDVLGFFGGSSDSAAGGEGPPIDPATVDLAGVANAKVNLTYKQDDVASIKGQIDLTLDKAVIAGGLPTTNLGSLELKTRFENGKLDVDRFQIDGEDVKGESDGLFLTLNQNIPFSLLHGKVKVKFGDEYQKKIPVGSIISLTFNKQPDRDGYFVLPLGGTLKSPKIL